MYKNKIITIISSVIIFLAGVLIPAYAHAEEVSDPDFGYSIDIPEGFFAEAHTDDGMSWLFSSKKFPVHLALRLYSKKDFENAKDALNGALAKLSASGENSDFSWCNTDCSFSIFDMILPGENAKSSGWALSAELPEKEAMLVLITYCQEQYIDHARPFFFSILNSLKLDGTDCAGPVISFSYPQKNKYPVEITLGGKKIKSSFYEEDFEASQFQIESEYNVLQYYAQDEHWKEAWQRFYRSIYRDSAFRLKKFTNDVYRAIYPVIRDKKSSNAPYELTKMLLNWVQYFPYGRNTTKGSTDITPPVSAACGTVSDCDSRSMLMAIMLRQIGLDSVLFVSQEYKHAVLGTYIKPGVEGESAGIQVGERFYILGETTAKGINPGLIARDQSDPSKWIPVVFD